MVVKRMMYLFSVLVLVMLLSACSSMYIPAMPSLPLLEEKGDGQVAFSASTNSLRLSSSYAFSNKFAVLANGNLSFKNFSNRYDIFTKEGGSNDIKDDSEFAHKYAELGIGWYNILKKPGINHSKFKIEIFGGIGYGNAKDQKGESFPLQYEAKYFTGFIQTNMGVSFNEKFTFGWCLRLTNSFYDYTYQTIQFKHHPDHEIFTHFISFRKFSIEPNLMFRVGKSALKFIGQVGLALPFYNEESLSMIRAGRGIRNGYINTTSIHLSIGIAYTFGKRKNKDAVRNE